MSDGNDIVYWFDGAHWTHGSTPIPDCPGPPVPGGIIYCGTNTWWISAAGTEGQVLVSHGADAPTWETPAVAATPPLFTTAALLNGWVNYGLGYEGAGFRLHADGTCELKAYIKGGKTATSCLLLPPGCRPALQMPYMTLSNNTGSARVDVAKSGNVYVQSYQGGGSNASVSLNGIRFPVAPTL